MISGLSSVCGLKHAHSLGRNDMVRDTSDLDVDLHRHVGQVLVQTAVVIDLRNCEVLGDDGLLRGSGRAPRELRS
jgi:hypothetical protein